MRQTQATACPQWPTRVPGTLQAHQAKTGTGYTWSSKKSNPSDTRKGITGRVSEQAQSPFQETDPKNTSDWDWGTQSIWSSNTSEDTGEVRSGRAAQGPGGMKILNLMRLRKGAKGAINRANEKTRHEHSKTFNTLLNSNKKAIRIPRCMEGNCMHYK